jgi:high-affinity Fe2+/Pb2+ permease
MTTDWIIAAVGLAIVALIIIATVLMMRHRERARIAAREAESLNVLSNDTRRASWCSAADHSDTSDSSSSSGGGDGGD